MGLVWVADRIYLCMSRIVFLFRNSKMLFPAQFSSCYQAQLRREFMQQRLGNSQIKSKL